MNDRGPGVSRSAWIDSICDKYEDAWSAEAPAPLNAFLPPPEDPDRPLVLRELVLLDCELRRKHGLDCSPEYYAALFPGEEGVIHDALQDLNPTLLAQQTEAGIAQTLIGPEPRGVLGFRMPVRRGDIVGNCEILGELGRGGMGIVYRARQRGVQREVAVKMMRSDYLDSLAPAERDALVERFQDEALATARVAHPHIITVYEVGEHEGLPYFSMYYAEGETLASKLSKGPLDGRLAASYLSQIARGIQAAHEQGILHRDLTPRNILFDKQTDRPMVADFGLAKLLDAAQARTNDGALMGSPPYMSPEQISDSRNVTLSTDVYGLGATLYHMLTGRPPFLAATPSATLYQVVNDHPVLPRELNRSLERDLETICMKCLHKDSRQRYASAKALAEDLERFLADKPILARPISHTERLWRWCRQNQRTASIFVIIMTLLTIASLVATDRFMEAHRNQRLAEARQAESLRYFQIVFKTVDETVGWVSRDPRLRAHGLEDLRRTQLERAATCYEQLVEMRPDDPELLAAQGRAFYQLGQINLNLQEYASAERALSGALKIQEQLRGAHAGRNDWTRQTADSYAALGEVFLNVGRVREADDAFASARKLRQELLARRPAEYQALLDVASSCNDAGRILEARKQPIEAAREYRRGIAALELAQGVEPKPGDSSLPRATALTHLARVLAQQEKLSEATEAYQQAEALARALEQASPKDPEVLELLVICQNNQADLYQRRGRSSESEQAYQAAIATLVRMVASHPDVDYYQRNLALARHNLASVYLETGRRDEAQALHVASREALEALRAQQPDSLDLQYHLGRALLLAADLQDHDEAAVARAVQSLESALILFEDLAAAYPDVLDYQQEVASCVSKLAAIELNRLRFSHAEVLLERALRLRRGLLQRAPEATEPRHDAASTLVSLGCLYSQTNREDEATEAFLEAVAIYEQLTKDSSSEFFQNCLALTHHNLSLLFVGQEKWEEAATHAERSVGLREALAGGDASGAYADDLLDGYCHLANLRPGEPDAAALRKAARLVSRLLEREITPRHAILHWQLHLQLAELAEVSDDSDALRALDDAVAMARAFHEAHSDDAYARHRLFRSYQVRGALHTRQGRFPEAVADIQEAAALADEAWQTAVRLQLANALVRVDDAQAALELVTKTTVQTPEECVEAARCYCLLAARLAKVTSPSADIKAQAAAHLKQAHEHVLQAAKSGQPLPQRVFEEADFAPLRDSKWWALLPPSER